MHSRDSIEFVVGEEKKLIDVLGASEVMPLLQSAVRAGLDHVFLCDTKDAVLWSASRQAAASAPNLLIQGPGSESRSILLEGEPVGKVVFVHPDPANAVRGVVAQVVCGAFNAMVHANLKRMLTTEIHARVVSQSYEELLESNSRLSESEKRYRELSASLEGTVRQRTEELKQAYARIVQQEKMASVGQLAAGIAHEINNPMGFILSNLVSLGKYVDRFVEMFTHYSRIIESSPDKDNLQRLAAEKGGTLKLDFLLEDVHDLLAQSRTGAERVKKIVADLKGFSYVDQIGPCSVDLNAEIERTLNVLCGEIPPSARVELDLADLPAIQAQGGLFAQVFVNLIRNAIQARPEGLCLTICSRTAEGKIVLEICDNGPGIAPELRHRVFEPFFTTREVGRGIGMGLTVVYDIVSSHGGTVEVGDAPAGGARIRLSLPLEGGCGG